MTRCDHKWVYASKDMFAPRRCALCGLVPCTHVWEKRPDGIPQCRLCNKRAHSSPSQLEAADTCLRKWGYARRSAQKDAENEYAAFGTRAHKIRENYLRHRIWPSEDTYEVACVRSGLEHWPVPGDPGLVAVELELESEVMGVPFSRKIDSVSCYRPREYARADDLKTCSKLDYAKTVEQLEADPQRILYAYDIGELLSVPVVGAQWTYCQRRPPKAKAVEFDEARSITRERMHALMPRVREVVALHLVPLEELPRTLSACRKYRSLCEYASHCLNGIDPLASFAESLYTLDASGYTPGERMPTMSTDPLPSLGSVLTNAAAALPPIPTAPAARMTLTPELERWVQECAAKGQDVRATAEQAMIDRGLVPPPAPAPITAPPAPTFTPAAPPAPAPAVVPVTVEHTETKTDHVTGTTTVTVQATAGGKRGRKAKVEDAQPPEETKDDPAFKPLSIGYVERDARIDVIVACIHANRTAADASEFLALLGGAA